jgi:hypothetical protein
MIVGAPKKVVGELLMCGLSEAGYIDPLRIRAADDVADDAVLSRRIEALQYNEKRSLAFRVQPVLQLREAGGVTRKFRRGAFMALVRAFVGWINVAKFKLEMGLHEELLPEIHDGSRLCYVFASSG